VHTLAGKQYGDAMGHHGRLSGGRPEVSRIENTPTAIRRLILAAEFVRDHLAGFEIERTDAFGGEVMVSRAADKLRQPAHH
jgi:hypothetical protein